MLSIDSESVIRKIRRSVGKAPRNSVKNFLLRRRYRPGNKPAWLAPEDLISKIYLHEEDILERGEVRWGAVVHANESLYRPGKDVSGAQVIYSTSNSATFDDLVSTAQLAFGLKGTEPERSDERRIADMLTDEYERALDWPIPDSISFGMDLITTIVMTPREHLPGGILAGNFLPILADPISKLALIVPTKYWERSYRRSWEKEAQLKRDAVKNYYASTLDHSVESDESDEVLLPVKLTKAAARQILSVIKNQNISTANTMLRVGVEEVEGHPNMLSHTLDFDSVDSQQQEDFVFSSCGITIAVHADAFDILNGTTIDYQTRETEAGFLFDNPNAATS